MTEVTTKSAQLFREDALQVLRSLPDASVDALITDPPYSSGGMSHSVRAADPARKYVNGSTQVKRPTFLGDNRDQRSYFAWSSLWHSEALRVVKPSGYALVFSDWRQIPITSDAIQAGGWVWRGIVVWDKTEASRPPHTGYFRHQNEYVVWATNGPCLKNDRGPWPGCFRFPVKQSEKFHITGKPLDLMRKLIQVVPPGGVVLDPFMGSGTTGMAALMEGRRFIGSELSSEYFEIARERIAQTQGSVP